jgi:predicted transcriptional regulator
MVHPYRDKTYIRKDVILILSEYAELNQTKLFSYCGLNMKKHKPIIDELEKNNLLVRSEESWGSKNIIKYKVTEKGRDFCRKILEPYEEMFPRKTKRQ